MKTEEINQNRYDKMQETKEYLQDLAELDKLFENYDELDELLVQISEIQLTKRQSGSKLKLEELIQAYKDNRMDDSIDRLRDLKAECEVYEQLRVSEEFHDLELTKEQAEAIEEAESRPASKIKGKKLPAKKSIEVEVLDSIPEAEIVEENNEET